MKNRTIIIAVISVIVIATVLLVGKKKGWIGSPDAEKVTTAKVEKRDITETVSASGKIEPETEVNISPDVAGKIISLPVEEGDKVEKGQLLVKINPDIYVSTVQRLEASLNTAKANLANSRARLQQAQAQFENAKASFDRNKSLFEQKTISQSDYDAAVSAFETAKGEVDAANQTIKASEYNVKSSEAALQEAQENLGKTTIYSPVTGTISKLNFEEGETVVGTQQMMGSEIMTIANLNEMEVDVDVNENDIIRVGMGDSAIIEVDAYLGKKFKGLVTSIANSAQVSGTAMDEVTNFEVKIRILKESYKDVVSEKQAELSPFRPGMSASVEIETKTKKGVLSVPIQAVTTRDLKKMEENNKKPKKVRDEEDAGEGNERGFEKAEENKSEEKVEECVFTLKDGKAVRKVVKTGIQDSDFIEISSGLDEGEEVITGPYSAVSKFLKDGEAVEVVTEYELYKSMEK